MPSPQEDWLRALQGQFPQGQPLPPLEGQNPVAAAVRQLLGGVLNMPQTGMAAIQAPFNFLRSGAPAPAAAAPAGPPPLLSVPSPAGPMRVPTSLGGPGGAGVALSYPTPEPIAPPMLPAPPMAPTPQGINLDGVREMFDASKPGAIDTKALDDSRFSGILGGLARGAGSVDATEAGSFAKALAMWGAGGQEGMKAGIDKKYSEQQRQNERTESWQQNRARNELDVRRLEAENAQNAAVVGYENAKALYQTNVANQKAQYEFQLQKQGMETPKIQMDSKGNVLIQQFDPKSGQTSVRVIDTTPTHQKLEKLSETLKAINAPGGEAAKIQFLMAQGDPPAVVDQNLRREAMKEVFQRNAGAAVFGQHYTTALEAALRDKEIQNVLDPKLKQQMIADRVMAALLPLASRSNVWISMAAPHSYTASILSNAATPPVSVP